MPLRREKDWGPHRPQLLPRANPLKPSHNSPRADPSLWSLYNLEETRDCFGPGLPRDDPEPKSVGQQVTGPLWVPAFSPAPTSEPKGPRRRLSPPESADSRADCRGARVQPRLGTHSNLPPRTHFNFWGPPPSLPTSPTPKSGAGLGATKAPPGRGTTSRCASPAYPRGGTMSTPGRECPTHLPLMRSPRGPFERTLPPHHHHPAPMGNSRWRSRGQTDLASARPSKDPWCLSRASSRPGMGHKCVSRELKAVLVEWTP